MAAGERGDRVPLRAASANLGLSCEGGVPHLADMLTAGSAETVAGALAELEQGRAQVLEGLVGLDGRPWTGLLRRGEAATLLELEPEGAADPAAARMVLLDLNQAIAALRHQPDATSACQVACEQLRRITGFDRVMAYRFMADWSGEVLAEALHPKLRTDSYFGLVFPASDIPAPARALYASNRLRLIPDVAAAPIPLLPLGGAAGLDAPVDLGQAVLRGVAPVHLQYLANMNVDASMSVAIAGPAHPAGGSTLWGLLACHHQHGPLFVDHVRRQAAETVAHALSWRLGELADAEASLRVTLVQTALAPFLIDRPDGESILADADLGPPPRQEPTSEQNDALLVACAATGLAVTGADSDGDLGDLAFRIGLLPPDPAVRQLVEWLDRNHGNQVFVTDRLCSLLPEPIAAALGTEVASGLLAMPLRERAGGVSANFGPKTGTGWLLWFKSELRRQVSWAGHKPETSNPLVALSPRASFAAWREEVAGRSAAWDDWSLAAAKEFRDSVVGALARHAARITRGNAELKRRNEEIRFFADAATHDLKEPLWQVQVLCGLIRDGLGELFGPPGASEPPRHATYETLMREVADLELETMAERIVSSANRMRGMIDDLARLAVAGRDPERIRPVQLGSLAEEALQDLGEAVRAAPGAKMSIERLGEITVCGDGSQLRRLFQNLFSNAIKYRDRTRTLAVQASARRVGRAVHVEVADNGTGFDASIRHQIFEPFRRFQHRSAGSADGLGLGLAICKRIVAAHGGEIEAIPLSPGACFRFVILDAAASETLPEPISFRDTHDE